MSCEKKWESPVQEFQKKEWEKVEIGKEILKNARNELFLSLRFFDVALSMLRPEPAAWCRTLGTDGASLYFSPSWLIEAFQGRRRDINRLCLHQVLHGLFCHPWKRGEREKLLYDLACDIVVESVIDGMYQKSVYRRPSSFRKAWYARLKKADRALTCEQVYRDLKRGGLDREELLALTEEFSLDSHDAWEERKSGRPNQSRKKDWEDLRNRMQTEIETFSKEASGEGGRMLDQLRVENRSRYDYREFLKKFSVLREEMQVDGDSFDYIFYHYGMELYGNMPLMEPLETKEVKKIQDFVIVVDTSMSCKGELVKRFLGETYRILSGRESFFKKVSVHILQCDETIQEDVLIESREDMEAYMNTFTLKGFGGTDFRPAFAYVESLRKAGAFGHLKGLLYFTDGRGIYPAKMPPCETAFVFLREDYQDVDVPSWAMKLIIDREELEEEYEY